MVFFVKDSIDVLIKDLENEKICFISFNYDRLLEYFLSRSIMNLYGIEPMTKSDDLIKLESVFSDIRIEHVYGRFDGENVGLNSVLTEYGNYGAGKSLEFFGNIKTIHRGNQLSEDYSKLIQNSERVYFLGFGFDAMNVDDILLKRIQKIAPNKFFATNYGLSDGVIDDMNRTFKKKMQWAKEAECKIFDFIYHRFSR